jgi:hypothetical protein
MTPRAVLSVATLFPRADQSLEEHLCPVSPEGRSAQLKRMDRLCGLALCVADRALLSDAATSHFDPQHSAVIVGSAYGCHRSDEDFFRSVLDGQPGPRLFAYTLPSSPVGEVSIHHGLLGPGLSVVTGRTAGLEALCQAEELLRGGHATACLVIACEVAAPAVPERPIDFEMCDGAAAILLSAADADRQGASALGGFAAGTTAFVAGDPAAAVAACVAELKAHKIHAAPSLICDPQTRALLPDDLGPVRVHATPACGAAAALTVFAALPSLEDDDAYVVVSADPCGLAAAVLWQRTRSVTQ